jgi:hypothetical protein
MRMLRRAGSASLLWLVFLTGCEQPYYYCNVTDSTLVAPDYGHASLCERASNAGDVCRRLMQEPAWDTIQGTAGPYDSRANCEIDGPLHSVPPPDDAGATTDAGAP